MPLPACKLTTSIEALRLDDICQLRRPIGSQTLRNMRTVKFSVPSFACYRLLANTSSKSRIFKPDVQDLNQSNPQSEHLGGFRNSGYLTGVLILRESTWEGGRSHVLLQAQGGSSSCRRSRRVPAPALGRGAPKPLKQAWGAHAGCSKNGGGSLQ